MPPPPPPDELIVNPPAVTPLKVTFEPAVINTGSVEESEPVSVRFTLPLPASLAGNVYVVLVSVAVTVTTPTESGVTSKLAAKLIVPALPTTESSCLTSTRFDPVPPPPGTEMLTF